LKKKNGQQILECSNNIKYNYENYCPPPQPRICIGGGGKRVELSKN